MGLLCPRHLLAKHWEADRPKLTTETLATAGLLESCRFAAWLVSSQFASMETPTVPGKQQLFPGGPIQIVPLSIVLGQFTCEGAATSAIRFPMTVVEKGVPADARGPVNFVPAKAGDVLHLGTITIRYDCFPESCSQA